MTRYFNTTGPCNQAEHYMIDAASRLTAARPLVEQGKYFVIHAARQSGKTTFLLDLTKRLDDEGKYYALYCSLEALQGITNPEDGIPAAIMKLKDALETHDIPGWNEFAAGTGFTNYTNTLKRELRIVCSKLAKPLVIFFDEADCLSEGTLITFLRQLREGYNTRSQIPFVHSIALVGMRNIRDYKASIRPVSETLGSESPFNIVAAAMTLKNFTEEEVRELYGQHTSETGQRFDEEAVGHIWRQTQGQPWLVNAIAREITEIILNNDLSKPVTVALADQAIEDIILRRDTHIDSLLERLKEERVRKVIEPMITGNALEINPLSDDYKYVLDLGLIRNDSKITEPANPIYAEVIARTLSYASQQSLYSDVYPYTLPRYMRNGKFDMDFLMTDFQQFWRENSAIWTERYHYKEAAPHLILQAFLQRVINGGGHVIREMAAERRRLDLCVIFEGQKYPIELKLFYGEKTYTDGIEQLSRYMDSLGCARGWLVVFDRRENIDWDDKIFTRHENREYARAEDKQSPASAGHERFARSETAGNKTITIVGC